MIAVKSYCSRVIQIRQQTHKGQSRVLYFTRAVGARHLKIFIKTKTIGK